MTRTLALSPGELAIVRAVLAQCLPAGYSASVFGSRATGERLKPWSDLDLSISGPASLPFPVMGGLRDAFDEAMLPWKVDLVDRHAVSAEFADIIDRTGVPLDYPLYNPSSRSP